MSNTMILQSHKALDKIAYKIVCKASGPIDFVSAQENVSTMFENKFHVVRNSLKHQGDNLYSMIIKANVKSIAADLIGPKSNKVEITAGIYTDASDNSIWKMEEVNGERRLVMMEPEDLEACFHYGKSIATAALNTNVDVASGDFITFYNKKTGSVQAGFAIVAEDGEMEAINEEMEEVPLTEDDIINAADLTDCDANPVEAALKGGEASKVLDYMRKIYKNSEMISELKRIMDFKTAEEKKFSTTASLEDMDFSDVKNDIQNFILNQAVDELKTSLKPAPVEETIVIEEANSDGDIDFATQEEMDEYLENPEAPISEEATKLSAEADDDEDFMDISFEPEKPFEEELTAEDEFIDNEIGELLNEEDVGVTTEAELDKGEFVEVEPAEIDGDDLVAKLSALIGE